jgi:hypothetical protein
MSFEDQALPIVVLSLTCSADGTARWSNSFPIGTMQAYPMAFVHGNAQGQLWIAGSFSGTLDDGTRRLTSKGAADVFMQRRNAEGRVYYTVQLGDDGDDAPYGLTSDADNHVTVLVGSQSEPNTELTLTRY